MARFQISGNIVNISDDAIAFGTLTVENGRITHVDLTNAVDSSQPYLLPGFIDAHVHIESSLLTPAQFARLAVVHGSVGTVSDPHEIANVLGVEGVKYMIEDGKSTPFKFAFGAPSCVPATTFETAGATIDSKEVGELLALKEIYYLAEMMNFPGVLHDDEEVMKKIRLAKAFNKPIDGHAPALRGDAITKYINAGISTDHECFTYDEALEKIEKGMKILIREGSAAKNFEALIPLAKVFSDRMMFCSDDKHPDSLLVGHINQLVKRAVGAGVNIFAALRMASLNPITHYRLDVGLLREGDWADFILMDNLSDMNVLKTYINGTCVAEKGKATFSVKKSKVVNNFECNKITEHDISVPEPVQSKYIHVIEAIDGQLITNSLPTVPKIQHHRIVTDKERDILKLVVVNRYNAAKPAIAFIHAFGLKEGAIASSVAHDSHNIIAVGVEDDAIVEAINLVIREEGGLSAVSRRKKGVLPLPVAGLMSNDDAYTVAQDYTELDAFAKEVLGSTLTSPYMTLSFMALLVIPKLKLSDLGLFNGESFSFVEA